MKRKPDEDELLLLDPNVPVVALDFETANSNRDSACALALIRVEGRRVVDQQRWLIRPPTSRFSNTQIHKITWDDVRNEGSFRTVWCKARKMLDGAGVLVAHSAPFDRSVLRACCEMSRLRMPKQPFGCTVRLSRLIWRLDNHKLPTVADHLGLSLKHHNPLSDALVCARIVIAARREAAAFR